MDWKTPCLLLIPLSLLASSLQAAELAGRIWFDNNKQPARNVRVAIICEGNQRFESRTDNYGFYRRPGLPAKQSCYIIIDDGQHYSAPLRFYSGQGRDTQNFALLLQADKLIVRKR